MYKLFTVLLLSLAGLRLEAVGTASHVIMIVWDGMRPDFVTEQTAPNLFHLAQQGVTFDRHHPVFVSSTEVNGTALATGAYPEVSGIIGNNEFRPAINNSKPIMTAASDAVKKGDQLTGNHYLGCPTLAELLHQHGLATVIAGAKPVTLLHDRLAGTSNGLGIDLFEGNICPTNLAPKLKTTLGRFPRAWFTKRKRDRWTTQALLGPLWEKGVPPFSLLWLSEPDYTQHRKGPGASRSLQAIRSSDDNLALVLGELERRGLRDQTDVIVVSDHAFSTIGGGVDVALSLKKGGLSATREFPKGGPRPGDILVIGNGGTVFLYVIGHDPILIEKAVRHLQLQPYSGVLFTRQPVQGAFPLEAARINSPDAPDIVLALRWTAAESKSRTPGLLWSDYEGSQAGQGMHGSLSPFDMHNTCIAAGPDFRKDFHDGFSSGNVDIAPTVLWILGVAPETPPSGRVLREALIQPGGPEPKTKSNRLEASFQGLHFKWHQFLDSTEVDGVVYLDQGNGERTAD